MHQKEAITDKIGMEVLDLKVEYFYRFIELKQADAVDGGGIPALGVDNITGCKLTSIDPALALDPERVCFGAANDFAVNVKLGKAIGFVYGCYDDPFFRDFSCDVINTGKSVPDLYGFIISFLHSMSIKTPHLSEFFTNSFKCGEISFYTPQCNI